MKKHIALFSALTLAFCSFVMPLSLTQINSVSALSDSSLSAIPFPEDSIIIDNQETYTRYYNQLIQNPTFPDYDCYVLFFLGQNLTTFIISQDFNVSSTIYDGYFGENVDVFGSKCFQGDIPINQLSSYNIVMNDYNANNTNQWRLAYRAGSSSNRLKFLGVRCNSEFTSIIDRNRDYKAIFNFSIPPYVPDFSGPLVGFPVGLDFSVADFMQWLVDNDKIAVSVDGGGTSVGGKIPAYIGMSKLKSFLEFYKQFGSSNTSFVSRIGSWLSYMNIANQTNDNIVILKNTIDSLYREYVNSYKHEFYSNSANQAHHRSNVNTQTTDDDLALVTDDANDDIYTTLLREIIRGIVALQSSTVSGFRVVIDTLNSLDFSVNVANNGGEFPSIDLAPLYTYDSDDFNDDLNGFAEDVADLQQLPLTYVTNINNNTLMPENMLTDKDNLSVNIPNISGFTVSNNGSAYSTQTTTYNLKSSDYPWLDTMVKKIKRFASILLIIGYLVHLRFKIPDLVRGE